jgi:hypothetical protein
MTHGGLMGEIDAIVSRYPEVRLKPVCTHSAEPSVCDPGHRMMKILQATVKSLIGTEPVASVSLGATDMKHWRTQGGAGLRLRLHAEQYGQAQ